MKSFLMLCGAAACALAVPAFAQQAPAPAAPAPVADLVKQVDVPYQRFTLPNGLRVIVHTDRKAPIVAVSVWYDVGSKFEPAGKTGFAHLFEHLMFNGSENAPGDFFKPLKDVGATDFNGTTSFDRTNYFETVPRPALDRALFLESDRMGYLTGAITQGVLDEQRGVVQNEKRQNDNQPYGLVQYAEVETLLAGTGYGHTTIGSMADLDAASLADVKDWFHSHYGPNNAVLVLAGDIDAKEARPLVEKYFGGIPAGPKSVRPVVAVPTLAAPKTITLKDRIAATLILRSWAVPGLNDPDAVPLDVAASVLGGLASSRLDNALVRKEKLAVQVAADVDSMAQLGMFEVQVVVRPGVDPAVVNKRLDEIIGDLLATGPSADEVQRVATTTASSRIAGLESVGGFGGKAVALASGELYSNDPSHFKKELQAIASVTPQQVAAAARKWLTRPALTVMVVPGQRDAYQEAQAPAKAPTADDAPVKGTRGPLPAVAEIQALAYPDVQRSHLSNGIEVIYANRTAVPVTQAVMSFDAGAVADPDGKLGTQALTLGAARRGHDHQGFACDRRGARAAGSDHRHRQLGRSDLPYAAHPERQSGAVARSVRRYRRASRVRPGRGRAPARLADRRDPAGAERSAGTRRSRDAAAALWPRLALCQARRRAGRSGCGQGAHPRRSDCVPPCLDPTGQGQDLRDQRSPARRGPGGARGALRPLAGRGPRRDQGVRRRAGPVRAQDHAGRPPRFAAVAGSSAAR